MHVYTCTTPKLQPGSGGASGGSATGCALVQGAHVVPEIAHLEQDGSCQGSLRVRRVPSAAARLLRTGFTGQSRWSTRLLSCLRSCTGVAFTRDRRYLHPDHDTSTSYARTGSGPGLPTRRSPAHSTRCGAVSSRSPGVHSWGPATQRL